MVPKLTDNHVRLALALGCGVAGAGLLVLDTTVGIAVAGLIGALCAGLLAVANMLTVQNKRLVEGEGNESGPNHRW